MPTTKANMSVCGPNFAHLLLISLLYSVAPSLIPQRNKLLKAPEKVLRFFQVNNNCSLEKIIEMKTK